MTEQTTQQGNENVVFIGKKPTTAYVLAVLTQFNQGNKQVIIRARGKAISKAVDVTELVKNRLLSGVKVVSISTSSEEMQNQQGKTVKVSNIEIVLEKQEQNQ